MLLRPTNPFFFFFNDPAPPEIYTLSLPAAFPISHRAVAVRAVSLPTGPPHPSPEEERRDTPAGYPELLEQAGARSGATTTGSLLRAALSRQLDRKSTRLNSSHQIISYAVFCLKKK